MENNQEMSPNTSGVGDSELDLGYRTGNLFIIDASPEMFVVSENENEEPLSPFKQNLYMFERILRQKLCKNRDDWMGIILFATTKSDPDTKNILTLLEFGPVSVEMLKELLDIIDNKIPYYQTISSPDHYPLSEVLLHASRAFDSIKIKMPIRQINLITCHDNPVSNDNEELNRIRIISKNFHDLKIIFKVIGTDENWNFDIFYKELEMLAKDTAIEPKRSYPIDLEREVMRKTVNVGKINLKIKDSILLNVNLQTFVKRRKVIQSILMNKATNEPLDNFYRYRNIKDFFEEETYERDDEDGGEEEETEIEDYPSSSLRKSQVILGKRISLTLGEYQELERLKPRGIEIIKFEKCIEEPPLYHEHPAFFMGIPSDASTSEKKFFAGLLTKCRKRNLMAICSATARYDAKTFLFRMWPCEELPGFYFYKIPFAEDINRTMDYLFPFYRNYQVDEEKVRLMEKVVKKFMIKYNPAIFPNPKQLKQMNYILALALNENFDAEKGFEDYTKPEMTVLEKNLSKKGLIEQVFEMFPITQLNEVEEMMASKVLRYDEETARRMAMVEGLGQYTVAQLRAILKALGQGTNGRKGELIERIEEYRKSL